MSSPSFVTGSFPTLPPYCTPSSSLTSISVIAVAGNSYLVPYVDRQDQFDLILPPLGFALLAGSIPSWTSIRWTLTCISSKGVAPEASIELKEKESAKSIPDL